MVEGKFLMYLLYITLVEIRSESYSIGNKKLFWLSDLIHNIPMQLSSEEGIKEAYQEVCDNVSELKVEDWLEIRKKEFYQKFPEFDKGLEK